MKRITHEAGTFTLVMSSFSQYDKLVSKCFLYYTVHVLVFYCFFFSLNQIAVRLIV